MKIVLSKEETRRLADYIDARNHVRVIAKRMQQVKDGLDKAELHVSQTILRALDSAAEFQFAPEEYATPEELSKGKDDFGRILREGDRIRAVDAAIRAESAAYDLDAKPKAA